MNVLPDEVQLAAGVTVQLVVPLAVEVKVTGELTQVSVGPLIVNDGCTVTVNVPTASQSSTSFFIVQLITNVPDEGQFTAIWLGFAGLGKLKGTAGVIDQL